MKLSTVFILVSGLAALVVLTSCQKRAVEPIAVEANDMCSFCRMSISEKRYAAEVIDKEGQAFKFDDIGCMANFIKQKRNDASIQATFVMDFDRREWLEAEKASYVRSSEFKTPMNGGIVAFKDDSSAQVVAAKYHGQMLPFSEVTK